MLEDYSDLSENLGWLLQSGIAGDEILVDALVKTQYESVYHFAISKVRDPIEASELTFETLAEAVIRSDRYQITQEVSDWLKCLAAEIYGRKYPRRGDHPGKERPGLSARTGRELTRSAFSDRQSSRQRTPWPVGQDRPGVNTISIQHAAIHDRILHRVSMIRRRKNLTMRILEIALAITAIGVVFWLGSTTNFWEPRPTGIATITPRPISTSTPILEPLTIDSDIKEIRDRIMNSRSNWHTLWADVYVIDYGPPGYVGQPVVQRQQAWIAQPDYSLVLIGDAPGEAKKVLNTYAGEQHLFDFSSDPPFQLTDTADGLLDPSLEITQLLLPDPDWMDSPGAFKVVDEGDTGNRHFLGLESSGWSSLSNGGGIAKLSRTYRRYYAVDTRTGVILGLWESGEEDQDTLIKGVFIASIVFDEDFTQRLYDDAESVWRHFSYDPNILDDGKFEKSEYISQIWQPPRVREPSPRNPAPPGYDPSSSRLYFEWTSLASREPDIGTIADIFADGYYLGSARFVDPENGMCRRSPDGRFLSYADRLNAPPYGLDVLFLLDLLDVSAFRPLVPELIVAHFAFAPDGEQLAIFGCNRVASDCGIYLVDVSTGEERLLVSGMGFATGITWSPDSEYLAFMGRRDRHGDEWRAFVVATETGEIVYAEPSESHYPADSPTHEWGVEVPAPELWGIEGCTGPPQTADR